MDEPENDLIFPDLQNGLPLVIKASQDLQSCELRQNLRYVCLEADLTMLYTL